MAKNIRIQIQAEFSKTVQQELQNKLKQIEKDLKIKLDTGNMDESTSKVNKHTKAISDLINQYKIKEITFNKFQEQGRKMYAQEELSLAQKKRLYEALQSADKEYTKHQDVIKKVTESTNNLTKAEQTYSDEQRLIDLMADKREKSNISSRLRQRKEELAQSQAINKALDENYKKQLENEKKMNQVTEKAFDPKEAERKNKLFFESLFGVNHAKVNIAKSKAAIKEHFDEVDRLTKQAIDRNNQFSKWFYGSKSSNLPTENTSMFGLSTGEMKNNNRNFDSWFLHPMQSAKDSIKSAKDSWAVFDKQLTSSKTPVHMKALNQEFINNKKSVQTLGDQFLLAGKKMAIWLVTGNLFFGVLRSFKDGLQTLKELDSQLVDIQKVTNMTKQEMQDLAIAATEVGIKFGRTAQDYLESVTEFSRAGYGERSKNLAEMSLLLQNVGDVTSSTANEMLLAVDAAYKLGGSQEELMKVIDMLNEVDKIAS
jgi:hypothetical protein